MKKEKNTNELTVVNLADDTKHIEEASAILWEEWDKSCGMPLEEVIYRTKHAICKDRVPQTYIALINDELVGQVSIWNNDLKARQDLTPWLAALYIKKEYRGKGIGTLLQDKCIEVAKELGYKKLYLVTEHENYYERTGWKFLETALNNGKTLRIYVYEIE